MAFATLEEAWGMPRLGGAPIAPVVPGLSAPPSVERRPFSQQKKPQAPVAPPPPPAWDFAEDDDAVSLETRRHLARAYTRYGMPGVLRMLPPQAAQKLQGKRGRRRRGDWLSSLGRRVARFLRCPEKVLFVLLAAFALLVLWDRSCAAPDVPLQHVHPFSMMPGMTLTTS